MVGAPRGGPTLVSNATRLAGSVARPKVGEEQLVDIVQFSSDCYYCDEGEGTVTLEVERLGQALGPASVRYETVDGSAKAGVKYNMSKGTVCFSPGDVKTSISIDILENETFDAVLEFTVTLSDAQGVALGQYLSSCEVFIADDDAFPTNKFRDALLRQCISEVPAVFLMLEYFRMNLRDARILRACAKNVLSDQIANLYFMWLVVMTNFMVDDVLQPTDGSGPPANVHAVAEFRHTLLKWNGSGVDTASAAGSGGSSASTSAASSSTLVPLPTDLDTESMKAFFPDARIRVGFEPQSGSVRSWYYMEGGSRTSANASIELHGTVGACSMVLKKIWGIHTRVSGQRCPYAFL